MKIGFVGAGKVGTNLARYCVRRGQTVSGFFVRAGGPDVSERIFESLEELVSQSDVIFLTVNDDAIAEIVDRITGLEGDLSGRSFAHTSGSRSIGVLEPLRARGATCFTLHPLQTFRSKNIDMALMETMHLFIEQGDSPHLASLLEAWGNPAHVIDSEHKSRYHLSASIISNLTTALIDMAFGILEDIGIDREDSKQAFASLIEGTVENIIEVGTRDALTGPVPRGDAETVRKHLDALEGSDRTLYQLLAGRSLAMVADRLEEQQYQALEAALRKDD